VVTKTEDNKVYDADSLQKLDPIDHIRKRISMYLGDSTGEGGLSTALREILDNSQDEFLNGHGSKIILTFFADGSAEVVDAGRGIPTGINKQTGENGIVLSLAHVGAGGKFGAASSGYGAGSGGLNGVGTTASNAVSARFDVTVFQNGKEHKISFQKGKPGRFEKENDPFSKFTPNRTLVETPDKRTAKEKKDRPTGTTIRMWPDMDLFVPGAKFDVETIKFRLKSTAFLLPGLCIEVNDLRDPANPIHDEYEFDGGIAEMLDTIATDQAVTKPIHFTTTGIFTETAPLMDENGKMAVGEVERKVDIDVAFQYGDGYETVMKSFVNIINTKHGGTHESGFYRAMSRILIDNIKSTRGLLKPKEEIPTLDDIKEGLTSIVSIKFPEPQFVGQEKSTLGTQAITTVMSQAVGAELKKFLADKKNATVSKLIYQKVVNASRVRLAARAQKETARKKTALETSSSMPAKLVACSSKDPNITELQICEGDSALGGLKLSRSSEITAIYPLKGKPLNVFNATLSKVLENQEWADLIQIIGSGVGRSFDLETMRYKRIILLADADPDGNHISVLLISFFWKYMRPLIEDGRLYVALPPLFSITTSGKNKERFYALNKEELDKLVKKLASQGKKYEKIQRHKGLGEYDADILAEVVMNPETRILRQITSENAPEIERVLELTMGANASDRRDWIVDNRSIIADDELDIA